MYQDKIEILERDFTLKKSITQAGILASHFDKVLLLVAKSESGISLLEFDLKSAQLSLERELTDKMPESALVDSHAVYLICKY